MKICILGNSHCASLKNAWSQISTQYPDVEITFFASRSTGLAELKAESLQLVPNTEKLKKELKFTSGGCDKIEINNYDIFVVYGLGLKIPLIDKRYSSNVIKETLKDLTSKTLNLSICKKISSLTLKPIFSGHNPQVAIEYSSGFDLNKIKYVDIVNKLNTIWDEDHIKFLTQPNDTLVNGWNTDIKYSIGSTRLDVGDKIASIEHPNGDISHMNKDFGSIWLANFLENHISKIKIESVQ